MRKHHTLALLLLLIATPALAQEPVVESGGGGSHGLGVGIQAFLGGPVGPSITYDAGGFRIDGIVSFALESDDPDDFFFMGLGGRVFVRVHEMGAADFAVGGGLALDYASVAGESDVDVVLAGLFQVRAFLTSNVALTGTAGLGFRLDDEDGDDIVFLGGQLVGSAGLVYFFR